MKRLIILLATVVTPCTAQGTGTIAGRIVDGYDGDALPGATIRIVDTQLEGTTDLEGTYRILGVPVGHYGVEARFVGYDVAMDSIRVMAGYTSQLDFSLRQPPRVCETISGADDPSKRTYLLDFVRPIAAAHGLEPIHTLAPSVPELRLWYFPVYSRHAFLVRLTVGEPIGGEVLAGWRVYPDNDDEQEQWEGQCHPLIVDDKANACSLRTISEPDWQSTLRGLETARVWALPDETMLPHEVCDGYDLVQLDGWTLLIELHDGDQYRSYHYWSPNALNPGSFEEANAAEILSVIEDVLQLFPSTE